MAVIAAVVVVVVAAQAVIVAAPAVAVIVVAPAVAVPGVVALAVAVPAWWPWRSLAAIALARWRPASIDARSRRAGSRRRNVRAWLKAGERMWSRNIWQRFG